MKIFYDEKCLEYQQHAHPETPGRVKDTYEQLMSRFVSLTANPCKDSDIRAVHSPGLIKKVKTGKYYDSDSPPLKNIYEYAKLSAGSAMNALQYAWTNKENTFSLSRPPGHHASYDSLGGFCYFNNIAIAVQHALDNFLDKVVIIDIDGHHGNGTQDIFLGNDQVVFISLHQNNVYPMSGMTSQENCYNYPLRQGTGNEEYLKTLEEAIQHARKFNPDVVAVSAGFDTYKNDPLLELNLDIKTYYKIGTIIEKIGKPIAAVLEGGYSRDLPKCVKKFLDGLGD